MRGLALMLLQAGALPPIDFDLAKAKPSSTAPKADEIVVTGRKLDPERQRVRPLPEAPEAPPRAEFRLDERTGVAAEGESITIAGAPSNRVMVRLKRRF